MSEEVESDLAVATSWQAPLPAPNKAARRLERRQSDVSSLGETLPALITALPAHPGPGR